MTWIECGGELIYRKTPFPHFSGSTDKIHKEPVQDSSYLVPRIESKTFQILNRNIETLPQFLLFFYYNIFPSYFQLVNGNLFYTCKPLELGPVCMRKQQVTFNIPRKCT